MFQGHCNETDGRLDDHGKGPIFLGGAGRSGTSLLRVMLDAHPRICCGPELKILPEIALWWRSLTGPLGPVMQTYGNSPEDVARQLRAIVEGLVANFRRRCGKPRWAEKTPHNVLHMTALGRIFPDARFVHVIRDGRDVACSLVTMNWADARTGRRVDYVRDIARAARYWRQVIETARRQAAEPLLAERVLEVRYEDLVGGPEAAMRRVLAFVDEPWDDRVLAHHKQSHVDDDTESSHLQVQQPVYAHAVGRWRRDMSEQDKREFKMQAAALLEELGYAAGDW